MPKFIIDGTIQNTLLFSGTSATGFLRAAPPCAQGEVWTGIDENGYGICGRLQLATLAEWAATVNGNALPSGAPLYMGDIVTTSPTQTGSIAFLADPVSLARMDSGSSITIMRGVLSGSVVPQLVVNNGAIWGRVLTSTGINFGTNGFIVGVRGTSISLSKNATTTELAIVDSVKSPTETAAEIHCLGMSGVSLFPAKKYSMTSVPNTVCPTYLPQSADAATLYAAQNWIRANTMKDIEKMGILATNTQVEARVIAELKASLPTDPHILSVLLATPPATLPEDIAEENEIAGLIPTTGTSDREKSKTRAEKLECKQDGKRYWSVFDGDGKTPADYCLDKNLIAFADFKNNGVDKKLYFKDVAIDPTSAVQFWGTYNLSQNQKAEIVGKTLKFSGLPPNPVGTQYLFFAKVKNQNNVFEDWKITLFGNQANQTYQYIVANPTPLRPYPTIPSNGILPNFTLPASPLDALTFGFYINQAQQPASKMLSPYRVEIRNP